MFSVTAMTLETFILYHVKCRHVYTRVPLCIRAGVMLEAFRVIMESKL